MTNHDKWRCNYHITPPTGWLNDPNGVCQYHGRYHVFFQYAPGYPTDDNKAWGHYTSRDGVHWTYEGIALYPDSRYDRDGAYSGNTLIDDDTMVIYYTGNVKQPGDHDYTHSGRESNTIRITTKDGVHFSDKQCVLDNRDYPDGYTCHIRDPKVWKDAAGYHMVLGARTDSDQGSILLYTSEDGIHWSFSHALTSTQTFGFMWECPDLFTLDGQTFLSCCPQGVEPEAYRYQNYHISGYVPVTPEALTSGDSTGIPSPVIDEQQFREWDYGFDFYAPQTFVDEQGRRILIGWVGGPDGSYDEPTLREQHWIHKLTLPRVLTWKDGILLQQPLPELDTLHTAAHILRNGATYQSDCSSLDWHLTLDAPDQQTFRIKITSDVSLEYDGAVLCLSMIGNTGAGRTCRKAACPCIQDLRILIDGSVLELFVNQGAIVMTSHFFPEDSRLTLYADGAFTENRLWDMNTRAIQSSETYDVTAIGELLIDYTPYGISEHGQTLFEQNPGSAPANVLAALSCLGRKTAFIGKVGQDLQGEFLIQTLNRYGIDTQGVRSDASVFTTLAFVSLQNGERSFAFARKPGADTCLQSEEVRDAAILSSKILHFGSLSLTDEPSRAATFHALRLAKEAGITISYDPNYRAPLWPDPETAVTHMRSVLPYVDIMKLSDEETTLLTGFTDPAAAANALLEQGISCVIVTLGAQGAYLATRDFCVTEPGFSSQVVDTTGAGDSFWGGILTKLCEINGQISLLTEASAHEFLTYANAVAACCVEKRGGIPAMPSPEEVQQKINSRPSETIH